MGVPPQIAIYCAVPAAIAGFRAGRDAFARKDRHT
jgi:hypothetical protein